LQQKKGRIQIRSDLFWKLHIYMRYWLKRWLILRLLAKMKKECTPSRPDYRQVVYEVIIHAWLVPRINKKANHVQW